jgi:hypothetical protein
MPDFTVIEGGGDKDAHHRNVAKWNFRDLALEILRMVSGGGAARYAGVHFEGFLRQCVEHDVDFDRTIGEATRDMHSKIFNEEDQHPVIRDELRLLYAAMKLINERAAIDDAAKGRRSQREYDFRDALEALIISHERTARANGRSYIGDMMKRAGLPPLAAHSRQRAPKQRRSKNPWDDR